MTFRNPKDVRATFRASPRRVLILTTVEHENQAVRAHLVDSELLIGEKDALYLYGRYPDPAGDWTVVHAISQQGNSDSGLVAAKAHQEFGSFDVQMFVGVAGSLKEDIPIGSVVIGDYVYNSHSAKVSDNQTLGRTHSLDAARELLAAAKGVIYLGEWTSFIRAPFGMQLPAATDYPCKFPPAAFIKGIASGEEVVAGDKSQRYAWIHLHMNDCGAVEMEGWGFMNAGRQETTPSIIVRGISDMCAGKDHISDSMRQPIAAAHAAAFAFAILSFRSKVPVPSRPTIEPLSQTESAEAGGEQPSEPRVEVTFNFQGSKADWTRERIDEVVARLKIELGDDGLELIRVEAGSTRLVLMVREADARALDIGKLREVASQVGANLLGAGAVDAISDAEAAKGALAEASVDLLSWEKTLPNGVWMERPEQTAIEERFELPSSTTVLLGEPGSGKSALLSRIAFQLAKQREAVFAIKADFISPDIESEEDLRAWLELPARPSELIIRLSALQPVYLVIDQLDALASQLDLKSGRLNVLLNLVRRVGRTPNVHVLMSARTFEFNHDVRLRAIDAESILLTLPPWHEVKARLAEVGIDADGWPESAREVVRIPQALKTYVSIVGSHSSQPFETYQAMLEQLWSDRLAASADGPRLMELASDLAAKMAEEEVLWLAASRFDTRLLLLNRLESLGFLVRSENGLSVAFSHQTVFDYVLARTFVRESGLLSTYVLERQDSLFIRSKIWSALIYLRGTELASYERELSSIWEQANLRRHLRLLLIEFLGQVTRPTALEKSAMSGVLASHDLSVFGLKSIGAGTEWFTLFATTAIRQSMLGSDAEASQAGRVLAQSWRESAQLVLHLINECWVPDSKRDHNTWWVLQECPHWTGDVELVAAKIIARTPVSPWHIEHLAAAVAVEQPDVAFRLVRAKLDFMLAETKKEPADEPTSFANEEDELTWQTVHGSTKGLTALLEATEWSDLPTLAEASPSLFLYNLWPWYKVVFSEILSHRDPQPMQHLYAGRYVLELDGKRGDSDDTRREKPILLALQFAIETLAKDSQQEFVSWSNENAAFDALIVQQLVARGYVAAVESLFTEALDWLLADVRRFQLGNAYGHRRDTLELVQAAASQWTSKELARFEQSVINYRPPVPSQLNEPEQRKSFADLVRATRKDLLQAVGLERLTPTSRELAATEERALGDRFDRTVGEMEGGFIGSPMEASAMAKAKDRDILRIFHEIPDKAGWNHPTHFMRGGNIQLSRAFAEFSRASPTRALRLIEQFEPNQQERAAGYALDALADEAQNDALVIDCVLGLHARGFLSEDFRSSTARAIEKIAGRRSDIDDSLVELLVTWLRETQPRQSPERPSEKDKDSDAGRSILWGNGGITILPGGSFIALSALGAILLPRGESGRNRYVAILEGHLSRDADVSVWKALLRRLSNAGGSAPDGVSAFVRKLFTQVPSLMPTPEAVMFLAYAQRWDDELVWELISDWALADKPFLRQAFGELVGLISTVNGKPRWVKAREGIISGVNDESRVGLAHAAVNTCSEAKFRQSSVEILVRLLEAPTKGVSIAASDVFRVVDEFFPDELSARLLKAFARPQVDISSFSSHFIVERLQEMLPFAAEIVAEVALKIVESWRGELGDIRTGTSAAAPQLTDLALTLHRLGGSSRPAGVRIFEVLIEINAYGARDTLLEIDGRFERARSAPRQRIPRRRRAAGRRGRTT